MTRRVAWELIAGALAIAAALTIAGCGGNAAVKRPSQPPATLAPGAVPYLPSSLKLLTRHGLAREAQAPALSGELAAWGFVAGADRYFQGESRQLQLVDSRSLEFSSEAGASSFVRFVRGHLAAYLGSVAGVRGFASLGRTGIIATAQPCDCHLAQPAYLGVVSRGATVTWLEINGPRATVAGLETLMAKTP